MKKILILLLVLFASFAVSGCEKVDGKTYYLNKIEISGKEYKIGDSLGETIITKEMMTITFTVTDPKCGTGTLTVKSVKEDVKDFIWSREGDNYYIVLGAEKYVARFDQDFLKMEMDGKIYYFTLAGQVA